MSICVLLSVLVYCMRVWVTTECVNPSIEHFLRVNTESQKDWSKWLPMAEFAYNNAVHSELGEIPMEYWAQHCFAEPADPPSAVHLARCGAYCATGAPI